MRDGKVLCVDPGDARALHRLGLERLQSGGHGEAISLLSRAVRLSPSAESLSDLGVAFLEAGNRSQADRLFFLAIAFAPDHCAAYFNAAESRLHRPQAEQALFLFRAATLLNPLFTEAWANKATSLLLLGRLAESIAAYGTAICLRPEAAQPYSGVARAVRGLSLSAEERQNYLRALRLDGTNAEIQEDFGNHLADNDQPDEARARYRTALCLSPALPEGHANLGTLFRGLGKFTEAATLYDRAIALAPRHGAYYRNRIGIRQRPIGKDVLSAVERLVQDTSLEETERQALHFALGDLHDRRDEFDASFRHYAEGNRLKRKSLASGGEAQIRLIEQIAQAFPAERFLPVKEHGHKKHGQGPDHPIFVLGMPRSGSSLIEQIIASHPEAHGAGERLEFGELVTAALRQGGFADPVAGLAALTPEALEQLGTVYAVKMRALAPEARRIADKMPGNFIYAGLIHLALPNARIIHTRRDPIDTSLSCFFRQFAGDSQPWSYDLAEIGHYHRAHDALMEHWRAVLPEGVMLEVRYEEVVADLEGQARCIIGHCGLDWTPRCLSFHETERMVQTASASQVRQPLYRDSLGRGRKYGQHLQPLYDSLNIRG